ncbi:MAG: hypothetical protein K6E86_04440 [Bacteroidales bacterium]|nr:hypothetical protein [Bacteroidales bacterium]
MKKVMLIAMALISLSIADVKAEGVKNGNDTVKGIENNNVVEETQVNADSVIYKFHIRLRDMYKAMKLDVDQVEELRFANNAMSRNIARLAHVDAEDRQEKLSTILAQNLATVHEIVDEEQYRAYLYLLNNEFNKTGLNTILYGYEALAAK